MDKFLELLSEKAFKDVDFEITARPRPKGYSNEYVETDNFNKRLILNRIKRHCDRKDIVSYINTSGDLITPIVHTIKIDIDNILIIITSSGVIINDNRKRKHKTYHLTEHSVKWVCDKMVESLKE